MDESNFHPSAIHWLVVIGIIILISILNEVLGHV